MGDSGRAAAGGRRPFVRGFRQRPRQSRREGDCDLLRLSGPTAGFGLNQSFIPYSPLSSYGRALLVGFANTLVVSLLAGVFATIIGFAAGFARLSRNWALARLAGLYVETVRNIPLLLQLLFWYVAILSPLPGPAESLHFAGHVAQQSRPCLAGAGFRAGRRLGRGRS